MKYSGTPTIRRQYQQYSTKTLRSEDRWDKRNKGTPVSPSTLIWSTKPLGSIDVSEGNKVFAKLTFTGIHQGEFMGYPPTQQRVSWNGCALFTFDGERITDVWVLGDLKNLEEQLAGNNRTGQ